MIDRTVAKNATVTARTFHELAGTGPKTFSAVLKFNPYHDSLGRFTGPGAAAFFTTQTRDPKKQHMADMAVAREKERQAAAAVASGNSEWNDKMDQELETILSKKPSKQALYLLDNGMLSYDDAVEAMDNGTTEPHLRNYFAIMKQNGDPTSTKPLSENRTGRNRDVDSGKYASHDEAKREYIKEMSGMNDAEAEKVSKEITTWTSNSWDKADTATIDRYIEKDHTFNGEIYRGMSFNDEDYASFMKDLAPGSEISMRRNSSWSSNEDDARIFAHTGQDDVNSIMIKCVKNRTSSPIAYLNSQGEEEVIAHSKAKWTVLQSETRETRTGHKKTYLTVVEKGEGG